MKISDIRARDPQLAEALERLDTNHDGEASASEARRLSPALFSRYQAIAQPRATPVAPRAPTLEPPTAASATAPLRTGESAAAVSGEHRVVEAPPPADRAVDAPHAAESAAAVAAEHRVVEAPPAPPSPDPPGFFRSLLLRIGL